MACCFYQPPGCQERVCCLVVGMSVVLHCSPSRTPSPSCPLPVPVVVPRIHNKVAAISGSGQQHGSVYLKNGE